MPHASAIINPPLDHNNPPDVFERARTAVKAISDWLAENPVIKTEQQTFEAKPLLDRAKMALDEMESERDATVRPLNEQVKEVNAKYKAFHNTDPKKPASYDKVVLLLKARMADYMRAEEERRRAEADALRLAAEKAEREAREAEARELDAIENASAGEVGVDVAAVTSEADQKFADYQRASRFADRAEKDTRFKVGGGLGNAVSLRTKETLHVTDWKAAIARMGMTEKIAEAVLSAAREYRKEHGELPPGIVAKTERAL